MSEYPPKDKKNWRERRTRSQEAITKEEEKAIQEKWGFGQRTNKSVDDVKPGDFSVIPKKDGVFGNVAGPKTKEKHLREQREKGVFKDPYSLNSLNSENPYGKAEKFNGFNDNEKTYNQNEGTDQIPGGTFNAASEVPNNPQSGRVVESRAENNKIDQREEQRGVDKNQENTENEQEKKKENFLWSLAKGAVERLSGAKAFFSWRDYFRLKKENKVRKAEMTEEIGVKEDLEREAIRKVSELRESYYLKGESTDFIGVTKISESFKKKHEGKSKNEIRKLWEERIKRIEEKLIKRAERRQMAKERAVERIKRLEKDEGLKMYEAALETLRFAGFMAGVALSGGLSGIGAEAAMKLGGARTLSMILNPFIKSKIENGSFIKDVKKSLEDGLDKTASFFRPGISLKERGLLLGGGAMNLFSLWATARGLDRYFETENWSFSFSGGSAIEADYNRIHGLDRDPELVANPGKDTNFSKWLAEIWNPDIDNLHNGMQASFERSQGVDFSRRFVEIWGVNPDNLHNGTAVEFLKPEIITTTVEVPRGQGAIKTFELLREKLEGQYGDGSKPLLVQKLLEMDGEELAKKYGFYNPNSPAESALLHEGDSFRISERGLEYVHADGTVTLLEDGKDFSSPESHFSEGENEKMFDSNPHDIASERAGVADSAAYNYPDAPGESIASENNASLSEETFSGSVEEILNIGQKIKMNEVFAHAYDLSVHGQLDPAIRLKIAKAFEEALDPEKLEIINRGGNIDFTLDEFRRATKGAFGIEITDSDISRYYNSSRGLDLSEKSIERIIDIYARDPEALDKKIILDEIFGKGQLVDEALRPEVSQESVDPKVGNSELPGQARAEFISENYHGSGYDLIKTTLSDGSVKYAIYGPSFVEDIAAKNNMSADELRGLASDPNMSLVRLIEEGKIKGEGVPSFDTLEAAQKALNERIANRNLRNTWSLEEEV